jgi:hypothetical protein
MIRYYYNMLSQWFTIIILLVSQLGSAATKNKKSSDWTVKNIVNETKTKQQRTKKKLQ